MAKKTAPIPAAEAPAESNLEAIPEVKPEEKPEVKAASGKVIKITEITKLVFEDREGLHFRLEDFKPGGIFILKPDYVYNAKQK